MPPEGFEQGSRVIRLGALQNIGTCLYFKGGVDLGLLAHPAHLPGPSVMTVSRTEVTPGDKRPCRALMGELTAAGAGDRPREAVGGRMPRASGVSSLRGSQPRASRGVPCPGWASVSSSVTWARGVSHLPLCP